MRQLAGLLGLVWGLAGCAGDDLLDFGGPRSCEVYDQNEWLLGVMDEVYLWRETLPALDPGDYTSPAQLMAELRYREFDRWSRVSDRVATDALFEEGKVVGFGFRTERDDKDRLRIAFVHQDTPAAAAGLRRGDVLLGIGGLSLAEIDEQELWGEIYGEDAPGVSVAMQVDSRDGPREIVLTKDWVELRAVPRADLIAFERREVGYLLFWTFVAPAIAQLDDAFAQFETAGVRELVVDLRYNGGGAVNVARHLMDLLVGAKAAGQVSYEVRYGSGLADQDSDRTLAPQDASLSKLEHIIFITSSRTLSASELVINAVRPHVRVTLIGATTGGKPVGSRHIAFCDKVAAPITFRLLNAQGLGDYFEGLAPDCPGRDDLDHGLGDPNEASLAAALGFIDAGSCAPDNGLADAPRRDHALPDVHPWVELRGFL